MTLGATDAKAGSENAPPLTLASKLALAGIFVLAFGLRVVFLDLNSFWGDEAFSIKLAVLPTLDLIRTTASDVHPPIYFLLLRAWMGLTGDSDFAVRFLSIVFDLGGIAGTFFLVRLGLQRVAPALIAALLHAISPFAVLYAQEARMYSLMILLTVWSNLFLFLFFRSGRIKLAVGYGLLTVLLIYSHIFGVFYWGATGLWWIGMLLAQRPSSLPQGLRASTWKWFLIVQTTVLALVLAWAPVIASQAATAKSNRGKGAWWIPVPPIKALVGPFYVYCGNNFVLLGVALVLIGLGSVAILRPRWIERFNLLRGWTTDASEPGDQRSFVWLMWSVLLAPLIVSFLVSRVTTPIFTARYFAAALPAFCALFAVGLTSFRSRALQAGAVLVIAISSALAIRATNYGNSFKSQTPFREAVAFVGTKATPRDAVLGIDDLMLPIEYYRGKSPTAAIYEHGFSAAAPIDSAADRFWLIQTAGSDRPAELMGRDRRMYGRGSEARFKDLVVVEYDPAAP